MEDLIKRLERLNKIRENIKKDLQELIESIKDDFKVKKTIDSLLSELIKGEMEIDLGKYQRIVQQLGIDGEERIENEHYSIYIEYNQLVVNLKENEALNKFGEIKEKIRDLIEKIKNAYSIFNKEINKLNNEFEKLGPKCLNEVILGNYSLTDISGILSLRKNDERKMKKYLALRQYVEDGGIHTRLSLFSPFSFSKDLLSEIEKFGEKGKKGIVVEENKDFKILVERKKVVLEFYNPIFEGERFLDALKETNELYTKLMIYTCNYNGRTCENCNISWRSENEF